MCRSACLTALTLLNTTLTLLIACALFSDMLLQRCTQRAARRPRPTLQTSAGATAALRRPLEGALQRRHAP